MRCDSNGCFREADESGFCCEACSKYRLHSPECNKRTYPDWNAAQYLDDTDASGKIIERLHRVLGITHVLNNELKEITSAATRFIPGYQGGPLELVVRLLDMNIQYAEHEAKKLLGG